MDSEARPPFDLVTAAADWGTRLSSVRLPVPVDENAIDGPRLEQCHRRFREISQRTRALWKRSEFRTETVPHIMRLGEESLSLSRMLCDELVAHTVNAGIFLPVPIDVVEELLVANSEMLDWLTRQIDAVIVFSPVAAQLHKVVERIATGQVQSSRELRSLSMDFLSAVETGPDIVFQTAADARAQFDIWSPCGDNRSGWFAQSLLSTWLLARTMNPSGIAAEAAQRLTMSALMQDLGGWFHAQTMTLKSHDPRERIPRLPAYHPSTGATMLSGLSQTPAEVALLVGAHHERADGSGFPQRLSGNRFSLPMQRLAWTARFAELLLDPTTAASAIETHNPLDAVAGTRLWREVVRGAFDQHAVRNWLQAIRPQLADEVLSLYPHLQRHFVDLPHDGIPTPHSRGTHSQTNDAHAHGKAVPEPQFLKRGRRTIHVITTRHQEGRPS